MGTSLPPDQAATLVYRIETLERVVSELRQQLVNYVPAKENELQLRSIRDTVERIEREVSAAKSELSGLNNKLITSESEAQKRDAAQRESQDKLQIRVLWTVVSGIGAILAGVLIGYFTHFFH